MKNFLLTFFIFFLVLKLSSQIPAGYYDSANGKTGYELKTALKTIITNGHTDQGYTALFTLYQTADVDNYYEMDGTLLDMYSEKPASADAYEFSQTADKCGTYSIEGDCYNREHLIPQSVFDSASPMKNDGHFVVPSDGYVNGKRSSYAFGEVADPTWTSTNGSKLGPNTTPGYTGTVFEPIDEFKGDIARMLFYFATRYEDQVASWSHDMLNGTTDQVFSDWFLDVLLQWHTNDPVSQKEIDRNEAVYDYQGNRNPFIDHPEWVNEIWSNQNAGPTISNITQTPTTVTSSDTVSVAADVADADGVNTVELHWGTASGSLANTITMSLSAGSTYITDAEIPAQVNGTTIYYEIYATDINTNNTTSSQQSYTISDATPLCASETFINAGSQSSYGTITWTGDDGVTWQATDARSDQNLNGDEAILLRIGSLTNQTSYNNGCGTLEFDYARIYTGNSVLQVFINGIQYGGDITVSDTNATHFLVSVNITGNIDIELRNSSNRTLISNLQWSCYSASGGPTISNITQTPTTVTSSDTVSVAADVADADGVNTVELHWGTASGSLANTITMSLSAGSTYITDAEIPAQAEGTTIYYEIYAIDNNADDNISDEQTYTVSYTADWCNLQYPATGNIRSNDNFYVYAQVYEPGVTDSAGQGSGIDAWIGYSTVDNDPSDSVNIGDWTWIPATYNVDSGNNDEYMVDLSSSISSAGTYYYASRFQINGGPYTYGGYNNTGGGFWNSTYNGTGTNKSGQLTVDIIDWCNLQNPQNGQITAPGKPFVVYAQIYEEGLTNADNTTAGTGINAWIGYSTVDNDPSDSINAGDWTWVPANYNIDSGNNDEFMADIGSQISAGGQYYYASKFQLNSGPIVYGGYNGGFWNSTYDGTGTNKSGLLQVNDIYITNIIQNPTSVHSWDTVTLSADITADAGVNSIELHWGTTSGVLNNTVNMSLSSGNTYTTDTAIPTQADGTTVYYEIYALDNNLEEKKSAEQSYLVSDASCASELIISEYIEGSSNNKYLELYNGTGTTINMNDYEIRIYSNGNTTASATIHLNNVTLADSNVYVLANSSANIWSGTPDQTSGSLSFNGDDAVELYNTVTGESVDIIGQIGFDPGSAWGSGSTITVDNTLVRKSIVTSGDIDGTDPFDPAAEWDGYGQDDVTHLGSHSMTCGPCVEPTSNAVFHLDSPQNVATTNVTINWTNGDGEKRIVVIREANPVTFVPVDGTTYTANSNFTDGINVGTNEKVVYNGNGSTVDVTGLIPGTLYYVTIYEYNCSPGNEDYFTSGTVPTDSFYTMPDKPQNFQKICSSTTSIKLSWEAPSIGNFDGYLLVARENAVPHSVNSLDPSTNLGEQTDYAVSAIFGSTTPYSHILYKGTDTSVLITNLTNNSTYTFQIFTYTTNGSIYEYSLSSQITETILLDEVNEAHASPLDGQAQVYWINPDVCYDEILVVANETAGIDFVPNGDGTAYNANPVYSTPNQVVYQGSDNNILVSGLTNGTTYYFEIFVRLGNDWSSGIEVSTTPVNATQFQPGQLVFVAYDGQYLGSGSDDEFLIATLIDIQPGTTFSLVNSRYEAGAPANVRTDKWGGGGNDAADNPGVAEITYNGTDNIPAGSILRLHAPYSSSNFIDYMGVISGTTETDRTADFSVSLVYGNTAIPNISASGSDQLFLVQGCFIFDGSRDLNQANYLLKGTLLHGITNRTPWVPLTDACNGDSSGGNTRESRLHPSLNCFNVQNDDVSAISGFYQNSQLHSGSFRDLILAISNSSYWTLGDGRYNVDPTTILSTDAGHTFTISGGHAPGTWVSTSDGNWFNCSNWETLAVPDATTDVFIDINSSVDAIIDAQATDADLFNGEAVCHNLTITNKNLIVEGLNTLKIEGDLNILNASVLDADDGDDNTPDADIYIKGNWITSTNNNFLEGNSTVHFTGDFSQMVQTNNGLDTEIFYNLEINNPQGVHFASGNISATNDLTITSAGTYNITNGHYIMAGHNLLNNADISLENQASLLQTDDTGTITGSGTFKLLKTSLPLNNYWEYIYWSSPLNSSNFSLGDIISNAWRYYKFDPNEANNGHTYPGWVLLSANDIPQKGVGYAISAPATVAPNMILDVSFISAHDPFNNGPITVPVLLKDGPDQIGHFNLIGNPYPSAIDFNAFANDPANSNISGAYYLWSNCGGLDVNGHHKTSGYASYVVSGTSTNACGDNTIAATQYIATAQGFMVEALNDNSTVTFKNAHRVSGNNTNFLNRPQAEDKVLWLNLTDNEGNFSQIAIGFYPEATKSYDRLFDAHSISIGSGFALYSLSGDEAFTIQGLPLEGFEEQIIPLGIEISQTDSITFKLDHFTGLDQQDIFLIDQKFNKFYNLKDGDYTIPVALGTDRQRFKIAFKSVLSIADNTLPANELIIQRNGNNFYLNLTGSHQMKHIQVFNLAGQLLYEKDNLLTKNYQFNLSHLPYGTFLLFKVYTPENMVYIKKSL